MRQGESLVALAWLTIILITVISLVALVWWNSRSSRDTIAEIQRHRGDASVQILAHAGRTTLINGDQDAYQALAQNAVDQGLVQCVRVRRAGQAVFTAGSWPGEDETEGYTHIETLTIGTTDGGTELQVGWATRPAETLAQSHWLGVGLIFVLAMTAILLTYRQLLNRVRAIGVVRECLQAIEQGESDYNALKINEGLGVEASVWNHLIDEIERQRHVQMLDRTVRTVEGGGTNAGDLSLACDALPQGMMLISQNKQIEYLNGAAANYLGHDRQQMVGQSIAEHTSIEPVLQGIEGIVSGQRVRRVIHEEQRTDPHGVSVLRYIVRPVRSGDEAAAMLIIEDITQQREAEMARHSFVAHATHELRTPLTNIRAYVETAIDDGVNNEGRVTECLNIINEEVLRLDRLIQDMLSVSEVESGGRELKRDDVDLQVILNKLEDDFEPQATEHNIDLSFSLPAKIPVLYGDREKLAATLANLLGNAMKYTPEGGVVRVLVSNEDGLVRVDFQDTGIGVSEDDLPKIFDKFYRAKDKRVTQITGTGLGLALSREVVRLHGGDITVQSQLNQGSTFSMTLPISHHAEVGA